MKLGVFFEFVNQDVLDIVKELIPGLEISISAPIQIQSDQSTIEVLKTNAKLFYELNEIDNVEPVLVILRNLGFEMDIRDVSQEMLTTQQKKIVTGYREGICSCGNKIREPIYETRSERVPTTHYLNDRVILKYASGK